MVFVRTWTPTIHAHHMRQTAATVNVSYPRNAIFTVKIHSNVQGPRKAKEIRVLPPSRALTRALPAWPRRHHQPNNRRRLRLDPAHEISPRLDSHRS